LGTVAAVRPVSAQSGSSGTLTGVNAVLRALRQEAINLPVAGEEIVIQKNDGNPTATFDRDKLPDIEVGNRVALLQTGPIVIIHRN
jgi:outer membrane lipoprotein SlyB